jgi:hypothetical protein
LDLRNEELRKARKRIFARNRDIEKREKAFEEEFGKLLGDDDASDNH